MFPIRVKTVQESDLRMLGSLARNIQRVLPVTQADIDAAAALGKGWVVWKVFEVSDPLDNLRGGTQLIIRQNSIQPGQNVRRVIFVAGPGGQTVVIRGTDYIVLPDAIANSLSYVKAFGGTEQSNLPSGYTQVNYVTNTAQTAVDTGVMIDFAKNYEFEVECRAVSGSWYILQSRASSSGNITGIHGATSGSTITLVVGNVTVCTSAITRTVGNKLYVKATLNAGTATLYVKDETANTEDTQTGSYGTSQPNPTAAVYLLGNAGGQYVDVNSDIYMARIKENDTVVMDYVPARQVATAGFYDKASGTFKTALTPANLSADGNTVPTPDAPMDIVSNNGVLKVKDSELPVGYRRVLGYACDDDVLWQITDFHLRGSDTVRISFSVTTACNVFGCYQGTAATDNYDLYVSTSSGAKYLRYGGGTYLSYWSSSNLRRRFDVVFSPNGTDGMPQDSTWTPLTFESANDLLIAATTLTGSSAKLKGNLYGNFIVDGRLKLIPCERVSDGVLGYFDTYSQTFYEPQGAATSLGYDTSYMTKVYADGTVETINVHGKNLIDVADFIIPNNSSTSALWTGSMTGPLRLSVDKSQVTSVGTPGTRFLILVVNGTTTYVDYNDSDSVAINGTLTSIKCYNSLAYAKVVGKISLQLERGTATTPYEPYYNGGTATAEMLLKVGDYQDEQQILSGAVTRKVGVLAFDGTENWAASGTSGTDNYRFTLDLSAPSTDNVTALCTHIDRIIQSNTVSQSSRPCIRFNSSGGSLAWYEQDNTTTLADFKAWLAAQYAAGTPVIIVYPLATPTTESVAGQTLQVQDGDNYLEITQASLTGLELEAQYNAAVSLTIQEVQDANLDNNVTVTIQ